MCIYIELYLLSLEFDPNPGRPPLYSRIGLSFLSFEGRSRVGERLRCRSERGLLPRLSLERRSRSRDRLLRRLSLERLRRFSASRSRSRSCDP